MNMTQTMTSAGQLMSVSRVFGPPVEEDGVTVLPVARIGGGAGGGGGEGPEGEGHGEGSGFGVSAKPAGVYVISEGKVRWMPSVDVNRVILGAQVVAVFALLAARAVFKARSAAAASKAEG